MDKPPLAIFTPLPPEQNGIADYSHHLLAPLSTHFDCAAFVSDASARTHIDIPIREVEQAFRFLRPSSHILHQIGNNPGHVFVLDALRRWGGVTTLHDQNLHYLYEVAGASRSELSRRMTATSSNLGAVFTRHLQMGVKTAANYALFDMLDEIVALSQTVIVHSQFAKRRLAALYGRERTAHVHVVPHLVLPMEPLGPPTREKLGAPPGALLIVTCGFATSAKRFDWLISALDELSRRGVEYFWIHAGKERPEEFALSEHIARHPAVHGRSRIAGYLDEAELNAHIAASDILINLRYPSVGESSGSLARAMAAGKCCVVSDTAAYAEISRDAVVHVANDDPISHLANALEGLGRNAGARAQIGSAAQRLAFNQWSPKWVALSYRDVILHAPPRSERRTSTKPMGSETVRLRLTRDTGSQDVARLLQGRQSRLEVIFDIESMEHLALMTLQRPRLLSTLLPPSFVMLRLGVERAATGSGVLLKVRGALE
jgi:glycosyltransferase involved in cell wall biosynthesis